MAESMGQDRGLQACAPVEVSKGHACQEIGGERKADDSHGRAACECVEDGQVAEGED